MIGIMWLNSFDFQSTEREFRRDRVLFSQGDPITHMFVILTGEVMLERCQPNGRSIVLQRAAEGSVLAEASLFSDFYHCNAVAVMDARVKLIARGDIRLRFERDSAFAISWANHLASEIRHARLRAEVLSLRTVAERLDAWIVQNGDLPDKGRWKLIAQEIGTSAEALYREIAARERGGRVNIL